MKGKWEPSGATEHTEDCNGQIDWLIRKQYAFQHKCTKERSAKRWK